MTIVLVAAGCSSSDPNNGSTDLSSGGMRDLSTSPTADMAIPPGADLAGSARGNTISGSVTVNGTAVSYTTVTRAWWISSPVAGTGTATPTVVYLFDHDVQCADLQNVGWDTMVLPEGTKITELKMYGNTPKTYNVVANSGADGDANANVGIAHRAPAVAAEVVGTGGTVTLSTINANTNVTGTFAVTYPSAGQVMGTYDAAYCAGGMEP